MLNWIVKKVILGKLNGLLEKNKENVGKVREVLTLWIGRIEKILNCFKSMLAMLDDNQLDSDEVQKSLDEVKALVKDF